MYITSSKQINEDYNSAELVSKTMVQVITDDALLVNICIHTNCTKCSL